MKNLERNTSIELLRIILMFMVVLLHIIGWTILNPPMILENNNVYKFNVLISNILEAICIIAVNCFIIISGYFTIKFSIHKLCKIIFIMWFYRFFIYLLFVIWGFKIFTVGGIITYSIPLQWWFMQYYLFILIASPLLNYIIKESSLKNYRILLIGMFVMFSLLPSISRFSFTNDRGFGCMNFIFMYFIGGYIHKYNFTILKNKRIKILVYILNLFLIVLLNILTHKLINDVGWKAKFFGYDTIFVQINAIIIFLIFLEIKINNKVINKYIINCSKASLAVYLIHSHVLVREWLLNNILNIEQYYTSYNYLIIVLGTAFSIYIICTLIELIRLKLLGKLEIRIINFILNSKINNKISSNINIILNYEKEYKNNER